MQVSFQTPKCNLLVDLNDSECAKIIEDNLPLDSSLKKWAEGFYFDAWIDYQEEEFAEDIKEGDVVYWPEGKVVAVFFGTAPLMVGQKQVSFRELVKIGSAKVNILEFQSMNSEEEVRIVPAQSEEEIVYLDNITDPDRKLTQSEIDVLVQKLLAQKKKQQDK